MNHIPLQAESGFQWFRAGDRESTNVTYDGATQHTEHWLKPDVFNRLVGGAKNEFMGIVTYTTKDAALSALRRAEGK